MSGLDISAFTSASTQIVDALVSAAPTLIGAAGVIVAGLVAFNLGVRIVRRFAK